jgi:hypothetical protein
MVTTTNKVVLIRAPDWQMLYVNGKLEMQDYRLMFSDVMPTIIANEWHKGINFEIRDIGYEGTIEIDTLENLQKSLQSNQKTVL